MMGKYWRMGTWFGKPCYMQEQTQANSPQGHMLVYVDMHWWILVPGWGRKATVWIAKANLAPDNTDCMNMHGLQWHIPWDAVQPSGMMMTMRLENWLQDYFTAHCEALQSALDGANQEVDRLTQEKNNTIAAINDRKRQAETRKAAALEQIAVQEATDEEEWRRNLRAKRAHPAEDTADQAASGSTDGVPEPKARPLQPQPPDDPPSQWLWDLTKDTEKPANQTMEPDTEQQPKPKGGGFNHKVALITAVRTENWDELVRLCDVFERREDVHSYVQSSVRAWQKHGWDQRYHYI